VDVQLLAPDLTLTLNSSLTRLDRPDNHDGSSTLSQPYIDLWRFHSPSYSVRSSYFESARSTYSQWQRIFLGLYLPVFREVCEVYEGRCDPVAGFPRERQGQDILQAPGTTLVRESAHTCLPNDLGSPDFSRPGPQA